MQRDIAKNEANALAPAWAREWSAHFLAAALSFLVLWLIAAICSATISFNADLLPELLGRLTFSREYVAPEPAERTAFFMSLVFVPSLMLLIHPLLRLHVSRLSSEGLWTYFIASCVAMCGLIGWGCLGDGGFYWSGCLSYSNPIGFLIATVAGGFLLQVRAPALLSAAHLQRLLSARDFVLAVAVLIFIGLTSVLRIFSATDPYVADNHFEAVFFTSTQVALGATLLVDLPHQYGLYPEFLAPVFRLLGGITVIRFTLVMAFLQAVAYVLWLAALLRVIRRPWVAMLTFLGVFSLVSFLVPLFVIKQNFIPYYDPYFQYFPVRTLFPAIALYAMAEIAERGRFGKRLWRSVPSVILGAGVLWNADAGIPALGAWILCLCHYAIVRQNLVVRPFVESIVAATKVLAEALLCAGLAITLGLAALALKAGEWPDPGMNWRFQKIFYGVGFFMLPMRAMHSWVAWAAVVMAALSCGIWPLTAKHDDDRRHSFRSTIFGWAVLACGLFSYYQGRSHDWVFPVVLPLALAFVGIAIDRLFIPISGDVIAPQKWRLACSVLVAAFVVVMASGASGVWRSGPLLWKHVESRWSEITAAATTAPKPNAVVFAKQRLEPGEAVLILSNHAGVYHAETQTKSLLPMSLIELILRSDRDDLLNKIGEAKRVFIDHSVLAVQTPNTNHETNFLISQEVAKHFRKVAESADGYLLEMERNPLAEVSNGEATN
jgi:hypothetical protein